MNDRIPTNPQTLSHQPDPRRLHGCLVGAYTCVSCNSPSVAAIADPGGLIPVCTQHARQAEQQGRQVLWHRSDPDAQSI